MYPAIQQSIWYSIGADEELAELILSQFVKRAVEKGVGSLYAEVIADTAVTLASANMHAFAGKVVAFARQVSP
jgi:neurofibromin 1